MSMRFGFSYLAAALLCAGTTEAQAPKTKIVVLGVTHSNQLVAESYQPAVFRAFFARVGPAAVCVERDPEAFARGSHHEFTYEIQGIALPWAAERHLPVHPFDWSPKPDDELLLYGATWDPPPLVRRPGALHAFLTYDSTALTLPLFYAERDSVRKDYRDWYDAVPARHATDWARRLFLYRTFLQARRVAAAAAQYPGRTVLVVVGSYHTEDIERILAEDARFEIVKPSSFGQPTADEVAREVRVPDLFAIATFNLLGVQSRERIDQAWVGRVVGRLAAPGRTPEVELLETRLGVLAGRVAPEAAAARYAEIAARPGADAKGTWNGVQDRSRLDSYFDPFGNLTIARRALLEAAREETKRGRTEEATRLRAQLEAGLSPVQRIQLQAYWDDYVVKMR